MAGTESDQAGDSLAANFAANLRVVCGQQGSISQICRKIKINRQQFNKYLSGRHMPSAGNVRLIANHFGLSPELMRSNHEGFRALVEGNFFNTFERLRSAPQAVRFLQTVLAIPDAEADELIGVYDRYHYSSIYTRRILRASHCIYRNGDLLQHFYIERFPSYEDPRRTEYVFKYHGFVLRIDGRVFTVDFESAQRNEMTFGILSAVQRNSTQFMFGITSGIAATMFRQPFSTRLVLHHRHAGMITRADLERSTTLDMNDASIPREAREYLGDAPDMIKPG